MPAGFGTERLLSCVAFVVFLVDHVALPPLAER